MTGCMGVTIKQWFLCRGCDPHGWWQGQGQGKQRKQGSLFESERSFSEKEHMSMQLPRCSVARGAVDYTIVSGWVVLEDAFTT